jgi:Xaa-Pro aminopeptidase
MDAVYEFRQEDNFYYLSGVTVPGAGLLVAPGTEAQGDTPARAYTEILFLPPRNLRLEKYTGPQIGGDDPEAHKVTGFDRVEDMSKLPQEVAKLLANQRPSVYTELSPPGSTSASDDMLGFLRHSNAMVFFQDVTMTLTSLRTVKDAGETALIRKAVDASVAAHLAAMKAVKPNVKEYEVSAPNIRCMPPTSRAHCRSTAISPRGKKKFMTSYWARRKPPWPRFKPASRCWWVNQMPR